MHQPDLIEPAHKLKQIVNAYDFVQRASAWLKEGSKFERRKILTTVGLNHTLIDGNLLVDLDNEYKKLQTGEKLRKETLEMFEHEINDDGSIKYGDWMLQNPVMGSVREGVRTLIYYYS